jgi:Protein of unknown function (DUF3383)
MANYISMKKIIDVSTGLQSVALARRNFSDAIFIQLGTGYVNGEVRRYTSAVDIASDLGSNCAAYKAALKYFAGGFNGIHPTNFSVGLVNTANAVVSTQGNFTTGDVETHLVNFQAVDLGEFSIVVDNATAIQIKNINLTTTTSLAEVAESIENALILANIKTIKVVYDGTAKKFVFTSDTYGSNSNVELASIAGGTGDDLTGATLLNGGTATDGVDGTLATTISNFLKDTSFYHIILDNQFSEAQTLEWSSAVEAATKYTYGLWIQSNDSEIKSTTLLTDTGSMALDFFNRKKRKSWLTYADSLPEYTQASFASYYGYTNFTASRPLGCLAFKSFTDAVPCDLTDSNFDNLKAKYVNFYGVYGEAGRNIAYMGTAPNGNFINDVILADWLDYNMTYNIYDWITKKDRVAYTSADFAELRQVIEQVFITALGFGAIAPGTDPDTGENYVNGYKIVMPKPSDISSTDKSQGILPNIQTIALTSGNVVKIVITNTLKI